MYRDLVFAALQDERADLLAYFSKVTGCMDKAYDLYQELCTRALRAAARFRPTASLDVTNACRRWLFRIARNLVLDERKQRRSAPRFANFDRLVGIVSDPTPDPAEEIAAADELATAVGTLTEAERYVVSQRFFHDCTYDEIADTISSSRGYVYRTKCQAFAKLEKELASLQIARENAADVTRGAA